MSKNNNKYENFKFIDLSNFAFRSKKRSQLQITLKYFDILNFSFLYYKL